MISKALIGRYLTQGLVRGRNLPLSGQKICVRAISTENKPPLYGIHRQLDNSDPLKSEKMSEASLHQNHIWSAEEIRDELKSLYRHKPVTLSDKVMRFVVRLR